MAAAKVIVPPSNKTWCNIRVILGLHWGYNMGIMEMKTEPTITDYIGYRIWAMSGICL